jgi:hypothetical protein
VRWGDGDGESEEERKGEADDVETWTDVCRCRWDPDGERTRLLHWWTSSVTTWSFTKLEATTEPATLSPDPLRHQNHAEGETPLTTATCEHHDGRSSPLTPSLPQHTKGRYNDKTSDRHDGHRVLRVQSTHLGTVYQSV